MKKHLFGLIFIFLTVTFFAQAPAGFNYQGVLRNASGQAIPNQSIGVRLQIRNTNASGPVIYTEDHSVTTDTFGLYRLVIGQGIQFGPNAFASINWGSGPKFLEVLIDPNGSTSYVSVSTSQFLSVPYALYAETSGNSGTPSGNLGQIQFHNGTKWDSTSAILVFPATHNFLRKRTGIGITPSNLYMLDVLGVGHFSDSLITKSISLTKNPVSGYVLTSDANGNASWQPLPFNSNGWNLSGNNNANTLSFLGTTTNFPIIFKTNNLQRAIIDTNGRVGVNVSSPSYLMHVQKFSTVPNDVTMLVESGNTSTVGGTGLAVATTGGPTTSEITSSSFTAVSFGSGKAIGIKSNAQGTGVGYKVGIVGSANANSGKAFGLVGEAWSAGTDTTFGLYTKGRGGLKNFSAFLDTGTVFIRDNLGIGNPIPLDKLSIVDLSPATGAAMSIVSSTAQKSRIGLGNTLNRFAGEIGYDNGSNQLYFGVGNVSHMYMNALGALVYGNSANVYSSAFNLGTGKFLSFQGATNNAHTTSLDVVDPTQSNNLLLPNASGVLMLDPTVNTYDMIYRNTSGITNLPAGVVNSQLTMTASGPQWILPAPLMPSGSNGQVMVNVSGSWQGSTATKLFWDESNGRLGIGTNTPASQLYIRSAAVNANATIDASGNGQNSSLTLTATSAPVTNLQLVKYSNLASGNFLGFPISNANIISASTGDLFLNAGQANSLFFGTGNKIRFSIDNNGFMRNNIGPGITGRFVLNTAATGTFYGYTQVDTTVGVTLSTYIDNGSIISGGAGSIGTQSNHPFFIYTNNGGPRMTVSAAGNVGVGTTSPNAKLDVNGAFILGVGGSTNGVLIQGAASLMVASIGVNSNSAINISAPGAVVGDKVFVNLAGGASGVLVTGASVTAANQITINLFNAGATASVGTTFSFHYLILR